MRGKEKAAVPLMSTPGTTPHVRGKDARCVLRSGGTGNNPACAGKDFTASRFAEQLSSSLSNCTLYPTSPHAAAATVKPTRPFSTAVGDKSMPHYRRSSIGGDQPSSRVRLSFRATRAALTAPECPAHQALYPGTHPHTAYYCAPPAAPATVFPSMQRGRITKTMAPRPRISAVLRHRSDNW